MDEYRLGIKEVFSSLNTGERGLSDEEAKTRLEQHGYNEIEEKKKTPAWVFFLNQFKSILIAILIIAMVISLILNEILDAAVIFIIIILNALLGFIQERKAERALEALKKLSARY